jgi:hypothetical protein
MNSAVCVCGMDISGETSKKEEGSCYDDFVP